MNPRLGFLVYDSRSGSTLLAKILTHSFPAVLVTPEIGFDKLLARGDSWLATATPQAVEAALYAKQHYLRNLPVERSQIGSLIRTRSRGKWTTKELISEILKQAFLARERNTFDWIIVKNGAHIRYWREISKAFGPDVAFIKIVRDPRAVTYSKINTPRPYVAGENMAWGGVALAALRWRQYVREMFALQTSNVATLCIHYEDFLVHPDQTKTALASFLGCQSNTWAKPHGDYVVPERERTIHKLAQIDNLQVSRIDAWKSGLPRQQAAIVEAIVGKPMRDLGYAPITDENLAARGYALLAGFSGIAHGLARHGIRVIRRRFAK